MMYAPGMSYADPYHYAPPGAPAGMGHDPIPWIRHKGVILEPDVAGSLRGAGPTFYVADCNDGKFAGYGALVSYGRLSPVSLPSPPWCAVVPTFDGRGTHK